MTSMPDDRRSLSPREDGAAMTYDKCDSIRYGKSGVMRCPHGCVTECARERLAKEDSEQ